MAFPYHKSFMKKNDKLGRLGALLMSRSSCKNRLGTARNGNGMERVLQKVMPDNEVQLKRHFGNLKDILYLSGPF